MLRSVAGGVCLVAVLAVGNCGSPAPAACPTIPDTCPSPVPSYATDVAPIIARRCAPCHFPGGVEYTVHPYTTYAQVTSLGPPAIPPDIIMRVRTCSDLRMPPPGSPPLTDEEKATLLGWIYCGFPNN